MLEGFHLSPEGTFVDAELAGSSSLVPVVAFEGFQDGLGFNLHQPGIDTPTLEFSPADGDIPGDGGAGYTLRSRE